MTTDDLFQLPDPVPVPAPAPRVIVSPKRAKVLAWLRDHPDITLDDAVKLIGGNIYANARFHVGNVLSAMVRAKLLVRVKPGTFRLNRPNCQPTGNSVTISNSDA